MNIQLSVIIPVYNTKLYLKEAIDSILLQKKYVSEIILINDGSTDGSKELLEELYGQNPIIKIIHTENKGQGHARNIGTDLSKGNFIYYFDSDDISAENLFEKFYKLLSKFPNLELFCFSGESFLDPNSSIKNIAGKSELSKDAWKRNIEMNCDSGEEAFNLLKDNKSFSPGPPLYIFKKSILEKNNLRFNHIRYEDEVFTHKLFIFAGQTYIVKDVLFHRRVREGSTMQIKRNFKDINGYIKTIENLKQLMEQDNLQDKTKEHLWKKILHLVNAIIRIKVSGNINLSKDEMQIYKNCIKPIIRNDKNLFIMYYTYSFEYKLRMFKLKITNSLNPSSIII